MKIGILDSGVETPEEIIMAAEMTPVRLLSDPTIELSKSNEHVPPNHCIWARNILEQALQGIDEDMKGIVVTHGCDCMNREFDIWLECIHLDFMYFFQKRKHFPFVLLLNFFIEDIKEMISQIEEKFKISISSEKIREAIMLTNKIRRILKELSEYRAKGALRTSQLHEYIKKVQQQDKREMLSFLEKKMEELQKVYIPNILEKSVLLTGSVIDDTNFIIYLEDLGFNIVADDLCIGTRYFWNLIEETGDPIEAIAKYHLEKPIYSTKIPSIERFSFLKNLSKTYKIKGVINVAQKFCEPILFDHPFMSKNFRELGIPYLFIELEYKQESYKQLSTRFEAFGEML